MEIVILKTDEIFFYVWQKRFFDVPYDYTSKLLINTIQIEDIVEKSKRKKYANTHALLLDFKWLYHNCQILYSSKWWVI